MKLWVLYAIPPFAEQYDCNRGFVVRAESEFAARLWAAQTGGDEQPRVDSGEAVKRPFNGWLDRKNASCEELLAEGDAGMILQDFNAG